MAELIDRLRALLAERYSVEQLVGRGSTAFIYLARDVKHDRRVAIKLLLPDLASTISSERFLREIRIAAQLSHPRILALYDSGAIEGLLYYVMPYVEGETLRDRLGAGKQLPLDEAIRITRDVASALAHAHSHGVVHRDIKPENILVFGGEAVVADFGIARAMTVAAGSKLTETGMTVGTPAYMSPEQATGSRDLDGRSDLYSLACVVYEMLAGHPPFMGATPQEILLRHLHDPVPRLVAARRDLPDAVERAVIKAMGKMPDDRFRTATDFAEALTGQPIALRPVRRSRLGGLWGALRAIVARATRRRWE